MDSEDIIKAIKSSFCNLTDAKIRNNFIEIITGFSTINFKFVSVFIHQDRSGKYIVSDFGWLEQNYYDISFCERQEEISERVKLFYIETYDVKITQDNSGNNFYYKSTNSISSLSSLVFDLANFIVGYVNAFNLRYKDEKEDKERETFRMDANNFLKTHYKDNVRLERNLRDIKNIRFNAIIYRGSRINLVTYVTGSTPQIFENGLRKSIVNFEISERSVENIDIVEKISIINDSSEGYHKFRSESLLDLLGEKTTTKPILWSERKQMLQLL